jgi:hypothetical protein
VVPLRFPVKSACLNCFGQGRAGVLSGCRGLRENRLSRWLAVTARHVDQCTDPRANENFNDCRLKADDTDFRLDQDVPRRMIAPGRRAMGCPGVDEPSLRIS